MVENVSDLYVGKRFNSWADMEEWLERYEDRVGHRFSVQNSKTIQSSRVKGLPEYLKNYEAKIACVRRGEPISKGTGARKRKSRKTNCEAMFIIRARKKKYFIVTEINVVHNHESDFHQGAASTDNLIGNGEAKQKENRSPTRRCDDDVNAPSGSKKQTNTTRKEIDGKDDSETKEDSPDEENDGPSTEDKSPATTKGRPALKEKSNPQDTLLSESTTVSVQQTLSAGDKANGDNIEHEEVNTDGAIEVLDKILNNNYYADLDASVDMETACQSYLNALPKDEVEKMLGNATYFPMFIPPTNLDMERAAIDTVNENGNSSAANTNVCCENNSPEPKTRTPEQLNVSLTPESSDKLSAGSSTAAAAAQLTFGPLSAEDTLVEPPESTSTRENLPSVLDKSKAEAAAAQFGNFSSPIVKPKVETAAAQPIAVQSVEKTQDRPAEHSSTHKNLSSIVVERKPEAAAAQSVSKVQFVEGAEDQQVAHSRTDENLSSVVAKPKPKAAATQSASEVQAVEGAEDQPVAHSATNENLSSVVVRETKGRGRPPKPRARAIGLPLHAPTVLKFSEQSTRRQTERMLNWLLPQHTCESVLDSKYKVKLSDLKLEDEFINDSFMDESVDLDLLKSYFNRNALSALRTAIKKKIKKNKWVCGKCKKALGERSVLCESCLLWFDFDCISLKKKPRKESDWFCYECTKNAA